MTITIPLCAECVALVDDEDAALVAEFRWRPEVAGGHVRAFAYRGDGKVSLARLVSNPGPEEWVDHINGNCLDNRRANLRNCLPVENGRNRALNRNNKSGFKGVVKGPTDRRFAAQIKVNGKRIRQGGFETAEDAARAYDLMAQTHFGEFARLNFAGATDGI